MIPGKPLAAAALLALPLALAGCGQGSTGSDEHTLTVLAAASLTDVFTDLAETFEDEHDVEVVLSFGSSTDLAEQAADGAPGDVLATADEASMTLASDAGATGEVTEFASNVLVIVTAAGNPQDVSSLSDLADLTWVRCADEVPCGRVALSVLAETPVRGKPVSLEEDVRATLDKVVSGEADAGLVYATDATAAGDEVTAVAIDGAADHATSYVLAPLTQSEDDELAQAWIDLVTSPEGRAVLESAGFGQP
ncbi:MAG: molybdate ABC transporter substrate-binding protein [Nocardioides sp.]|uniref:molybdate ABC transporter substrate-binding protein n=1 Tax=Nocardioides sp. TaxID=35761 RepID=UPI003F0FB6D8